MYDYMYDDAKDYEYYLTKLSIFIHGTPIEYKSLFMSTKNHIVEYNILNCYFR